jgi:hypothetical protein
MRELFCMEKFFIVGKSRRGKFLFTIYCDIRHMVYEKAKEVNICGNIKKRMQKISLCFQKIFFKVQEQNEKK